jgi:Asp-tRNA(Asn)/Glu-tRNA(Gln) amidotransferase B subunit
MSAELDLMLTKYSTVNHTRCFAHILNLVAKSLLKQFDVKQDDKEKDDLNDNKQALLDLVGDIEQEELTTAQEKDDVDNETEEEDDLEGWVDEVEALTLEEWENLEDSI